MNNDKRKALIQMIDVWMRQLNDDNQKLISENHDNDIKTKGEENGQ